MLHPLVVANVSVPQSSHKSLSAGFNFTTKRLTGTAVSRAIEQFEMTGDKRTVVPNDAELPENTRGSYVRRNYTDREVELFMAMARRWNHGSR